MLKLLDVFIYSVYFNVFCDSESSYHSSIPHRSKCLFPRDISGRGASWMIAIPPQHGSIVWVRGVSLANRPWLFLSLVGDRRTALCFLLLFCHPVSFIFGHELSFPNDPSALASEPIVLFFLDLHKMFLQENGYFYRCNNFSREGRHVITSEES